MGGQIQMWGCLDLLYTWGIHDTHPCTINHAMDDEFIGFVERRGGGGPRLWDPLGYESCQNERCRTR